MVRPADSVDDGADFFHVAVFADGGVGVGGFDELVGGNAGDAGDHFRRVARVVLLEQLEDAIRILEREIVVDVLGQRWQGSRSVVLARGHARRILLGLPAVAGIVPGGAIVGEFAGVEAGENAVGVGREFEAAVHHERGVGEVDEIFVGDAIVLDSVIDYAAEEGDVRPGADLAKHVGNRGSSREARVDRNHLGVAIALGFNGPLEAAGVILRWVAAHDEHHVGIFYIDPAIGHCAPAKRWSQT